jgi:Bacterial transcriptional activator domain
VASRSPPPTGRGHEWAVVHRTEMETVIAEVAEGLALRYLNVGDHRQANWAARRGLLASPYDERLYRVLMRAADAAGNPAGVDAIWKEPPRTDHAVIAAESAPATRSRSAIGVTKLSTVMDEGILRVGDHAAERPVEAPRWPDGEPIVSPGAGELHGDRSLSA